MKEQGTGTWKPIVLQKDEGEKILFRVGLMTFKAASADTANQFMISETILPPGANVEPHKHSEAETFYIVEGEFTFYVEDMSKPVLCGKGAFLSVPPNVLHSFVNHTPTQGKILGMMMPGGTKGLESLFRQFGVVIKSDEQIPDLNQPISHTVEILAKLRNEQPDE